jgi:hypothetical protein
MSLDAAKRAATAKEGLSLHHRFRKSDIAPDTQRPLVARSADRPIARSADRHLRSTFGPEVASRDFFDHCFGGRIPGEFRQGALGTGFLQTGVPVSF